MKLLRTLVFSLSLVLVLSSLAGCVVETRRGRGRTVHVHQRGQRAHPGRHRGQARGRGHGNGRGHANGRGHGHGNGRGHGHGHDHR